MNEDHLNGNGQGRPPPASPPLLASVTETKRLLSIGNTKCWSLIGAGDLDTVLVGRRRYVTYASIERLVSSGRGR